MMTGALAGILAALSGCGLRPPTAREKLNAEVEEVDHVTSSEVTRSGDGTMRTRMSGDIYFDVSGDELLTALDAAWLPVVEYVHDLDDGDGRRQSLVTAHGEDGSTAEPRDLLGPDYDDHGQPVPFSAFFEHYGIG